MFQRQSLQYFLFHLSHIMRELFWSNVPYLSPRIRERFIETVLTFTLQAMAPISGIQAEALQPFHEDRGTFYRTTQAELDFHQASRFRSRNRGPFISPIQATTELIRHNDLRRQSSEEEQAAIDRLIDLIEAIEDDYKWGPDIAIKCFADLDLVLFDGKLRGNVCVKWMTCGTDARLRLLRVHKAFGLTEHPRIFEKGQCFILLNADTLLNNDRCLACFRAMFSTLLHEMCHAYDHVTSPRRWLSIGRENAHGEQFCTRISAVHRRAESILGLEAIGYWEPYMRPHCLADEDEGGYLACGDGQVVPQSNATQTHSWSNAHVGSSRNDRSSGDNRGGRDGGKRIRGTKGRQCVIM